MKNIYFCCRTSHEVRGLKFSIRQKFVKKNSRTSHEVRGLKSLYRRRLLMYSRRTSHEVRGLKFNTFAVERYPRKSHLTRGAWIEIRIRTEPVRAELVAPHTRCVD